MAMEKGDSCNVSCISGSAHAGTHVDLPFHFSDAAAEPPLDVFFGPAVVIEVEDWAAVSNLHTREGMRVLFKTRNSSTPSHEFDPQFFCLDAHAVQWLVDRNASLVGVDGPSVDPADSRDLPNHKKLLAAEIGILENLDLSAADPGEYTLSALPLFIPGADAAWVRAVLIRP